MQLAANTVQLVSGGNIIKQGSETPFVFKFLDENSEVVDLQGASVQIRLANQKALLLEKNATINEDNTFTFSLTKDDVVGNGNMRLEFIVTYSDGKEELFPAEGWQEIKITPSLKDLDISGGVAVITVQKLTADVNKAVTDSAEALNTVTTVQSQFNKIVAEAGSNNPEVVQARAEYGTLNERLNSVDADLAQKANQTDLDTQKSRIDNIVALPAGADNAETADIRVGADGNTYSSAGTAVREQFTNIKNSLTKTINSTLQKVSSKIYETALNAFSAQSLTFKGFASRYANTGTFNRVDVWASYWFTTVTQCKVNCTIYDDSLNVLAKANTTISTTNNGNAQLVRFDFDKDVTPTGANFYVAVTVEDTVNCGIRVDQSEKGFTTGTSEYRNKYTQDGKTWLSVSSATPNQYPLGVVIYSTSYKLKNSGNIIYVGKQSGYDFQDIQSAIDSITDDSADNPYVIYVMPGTYGRFSMTDNNSKVRYVSLIGIDRLSCIVKDDTGNYNTPTSEIKLHGTIENFSFIMAATAETYNPDATRPYAYAMHTDYTGARTTLFKNCYFESNSGPAVGCGTHADVTLIFDGCESIRKVGYGTDQGSLFYHTNVGDLPNQKIIIRHCEVVNEVSPTSDGIRLRVVDGSLAGNYKAIVQNSISYSSTQPYAIINDGILDKLSFGNVPATLNYQ